MDQTLFYYFCRIFMAVGFALAVLDFASTMAALAYGGREANPLWRWVMAVIAMVSTKKGLWGVARIWLALLIVWLGVGNATAPFVWYTIPAAIIPNTVLAYVVWRNFGIAKNLREMARSKLR